MEKQEWPRVLEIQRAGITERAIYGAVAVATPDRVLRTNGGDPIIFARSLLKPYQMKPIAADLEPVLDWPARAIALSSHNGTAEQSEIARQIIKPEDGRLLELPATAPMDGHTKEKWVWSNPCSGKHAAILRACQLRGWSTEGYLERRHPYNVEYIKTVERTLNLDLGDRAFAPDGCGLPTFAVKVSELARLFAALARDAETDWVWEAFHRHPELIGGEGRLDTRLNGDARLLAKEGADGLLGIALRSAEHPDGLGLVVKLAHGYDPRVMEVLASELLARLGFDFSSRVDFPGQTYRARFDGI